jgi:hypothetical protein
MSSLLTLTASTFLAQFDNKAIVLDFEGLHYGSNEVVPYHIAKANLQHKRQTAGAYVDQCMTEKHGGERKNWPQIAQQFVADRPTDRASQSRKRPQ